MQKFVRESQFALRNRNEYQKDLEKLAQSDSHVRGLKWYSKLNDLKYFHTTENYVNDIMHTVFQGDMRKLKFIL